MTPSPPEREIIRADRSPLNRRVWCYELSCGHEVWKSGRKITKKALPCEKCLHAAEGFELDTRRTS